MTSNIVSNLGVSLDPTLSFQQQISAICQLCDLKLWMSAICHYLSEDVTPKLLCVLVYCNSLLAGCARYLLSNFQKVWNNTARLIFRTSSAPMSHICFIFFTSFLLSSGSNTYFILFKIISHLPFRPSASLHSFAAVLLFCSVRKCHPSTLSPVVSSVSLFRLQLSGTNSLFLSIIPPQSVLSNLP